MARTVNEPVKFSDHWIRATFLAYSIFVIASITFFLAESKAGDASFDLFVVWTFLFGPVLGVFAFLDGRKINAATELSYNVQIAKPWLWAAGILAFSPVGFWIYVIQRRRVASTYPRQIVREQNARQREGSGYSVNLSSLPYPAAILTYFISFDVSLFYLLRGFSFTYAVIPWFFVYGPLTGLFVAFDFWKLNSGSNERHLTQRFWAVFVWLFFFVGFWFYFLERRNFIRAYDGVDRSDQSRLELWSARLYDSLKVNINRVFYSVVPAAGSQERKYREEASRQQAQGERKKPSLDSQIDAALDLFGLDTQASKDLVRKRYHELMAEYHPDKLGQATDAQRRLIEEKTKEINRAHDLLERYFAGGTRTEPPSRLELITRAIEGFTPSTVWSNETGYQAELYSVLKPDFPELSVDPKKDSSRPDLVFEDIGIEIKGPTNGRELKTISDECLRYSPLYHNLIFVLFQPDFTELLFKEVSDGINRNFPNTKIIRQS